ncbi:MAG TPA: hypothetical protein VIB47_02650 [Dehalococcoidia bacterium]
MLPEIETLLPSAARTASPPTIRVKNRGFRGVIFTVHTTAIGAAPSIQLFMRLPNAAGAFTAHTYWNITAAIAAVSANEYLLYPGASGGNFTEVDAIPLPAEFDLQMVHANGDSITYDLVAHWLP